MIKDIAWNVFKTTGDINTFLELKEIQNVMANSQINKLNSNNKEENKYYKYSKGGQ